MKKTKACGFILYYREKEELKFLLVQHHAGHWGFPKGHQEKKETNLATALRETKEETAITQINVKEKFQTSQFYQVNNKQKEVVYFLGESKQKKVVIQQEELKSYQWLPPQEVLKKITFQNTRNSFKKALSFIETLSKTS